MKKNKEVVLEVHPHAAKHFNRVDFHGTDMFVFSAFVPPDMKSIIAHSVFSPHVVI